MLEPNNYELFKEGLIASQRLFNKLKNVIYNASNIEYDGSGFYADEEEMYARHRAKLSSKILEELSSVLEGYKIKLIANDDLSLYELTFDLSKDNEKSIIKVDFTQEDSLNVLQLS